METKEKRTGMNYGLMALMGLVGVLALGTMGASASVITDIPEQVNDALLGGASLWAAQMLLTAVIMMGCGLTLAMLRLPPAGIFIVLLTVLGALTGIGWADATFLAMAGFIAVALFGRTLVDWALEKTGSG